MGLSGFDLDELVGGIDNFWSDKEARNRPIHDDWFPSLEEGELGRVGTRGLKRKKVPEEVIGWPGVDEVWVLRIGSGNTAVSSRTARGSCRETGALIRHNDRPIGPAP